MAPVSMGLLTLVVAFGFGDAGKKLSSEEFYRNLPVPTVEFAVIAGNTGQKLTFNEPNDGIITVESSKLPGMKDWIVLHHAHTFIMNCADTAACCVQFLHNGCLKDKQGDRPILCPE